MADQVGHDVERGREYILTTQGLDIYGTAKAYTGPVRLIHGSKDTIVPISCSEKFVEEYTQDAELIVVQGENHMITRKLRTVVSLAVSFFVNELCSPALTTPRLKRSSVSAEEHGELNDRGS